MGFLFNPSWDVSVADGSEIGLLRGDPAAKELYEWKYWIEKDLHGERSEAGGVCRFLL